MKANIPKKLEDLINEKIYLDLEIHVLTKWIEKASRKNDQGSLLRLKPILDEKFKALRLANDELRSQNVKIHKPVYDDLFVQYDFYIKQNGGFKEGNFRYWKSAIKYTLRQRLKI